MDTKYGRELPPSKVDRWPGNDAAQFAYELARRLRALVNDTQNGHGNNGNGHNGTARDLLGSGYDHVDGNGNNGHNGNHDSHLRPIPPYVEPNGSPFHRADGDTIRALSEAAAEMYDRTQAGIKGKK